MGTDKFDPSDRIYKTHSNGKVKHLSMLDLFRYFTELGQMRVTDLHLKVDQPPCYRVDGEIRRIQSAPLDADILRRLVFSVLSPEGRAAVDQKHAVDASYDYEDIQLRIHVFHDTEGITAAIRALPNNIPRIEDLGFPNRVWEDIVNRGQGLVLVTGMTGVGKSTTICSLIEKMNRTRACRIVTIEDPIEHVFKQRRALISQREIGRHVASFEDGLREVAREDPDVIFVGEMRDTESISSTLTAAEMGHLVFSPLHTRDATGSITRILDYFPDSRRREVQNQLSLGLSYVISQKLIPRKDGTGRVPAMEILKNTYSVANLIRTDRLEQIYNILQTHGADTYNERMITMETSIAKLVWDGIVDRDEAVKWVNKIDVFEGLLDSGQPL